jgi:hypothetical protein
MRLYDALFPTMWCEEWLTEILATFGTCTDLRSLYLEINPDAVIRNKLWWQDLAGGLTDDLGTLVKTGAMPALLKLRVTADVPVHFGSQSQRHNDTYEVSCWSEGRFSKC